MQAVHEAGHVLGAWATGGEVTRVVLHPLGISRTDIGHNPQPRVVVWAGPILGSLLPILLWLAAEGVRLPGAYVLRFFAGFCLLANGLYLGLGSFARIGDCGELLEPGEPPWKLWLFGLATTPVGLALWHRLGPHFGLGSTPQPLDRHVVYATTIACCLLVFNGLVFSH